MSEVLRVVDREWHQSQEASRLLASIEQQVQGGGLLLEGNFPQFDLFGVKVLLQGGSSSGKSTLFNILAAPDTERSVAAAETKGMQMARITWAAKLTNTGDVALFSIGVWDAGHRTWHEYDHIKEECERDTAVRAIVFSLKDKASWATAKQMADALPADARFFFVGTSYDLAPEHLEVAVDEVQQWSDAMGVAFCLTPAGQRSEHIRIRRRFLNLVCDTALRSE
ncbi:hypothetical protein PTSG_00230 [Salpingoeca rosetta]|uniref:Ciliogenesis and planar polarity effector 2 n=1 Tax=Salpingoeca rosetta (strain ATCC 50818 / BSB-021) TaxID=946362 RepID=F2TVW3_SALR5|nr:uncharacterized protein PTSG_00230 [Salpingoeca rosetta]EGD72209.1 hypothetical protein PTSG_00230 [Salpingoeca rosetta]|eukprot:XP_004998780.1 hypothetical protein PTSG_00230 [Salpingoeca rosetta]